VRLSSLKGGVRELPVEFPGENGAEDEVLNVQYRPGELTIEAAEQMRDAIAADRTENVALILLEKVLVGWDLQQDVYDEAGNSVGVEDVPCDRQGLRIIPLPALGVIMNAMMEDVRPDPQKDVPSEDGSLQEGTSDTSQNGTLSSEPQSTTESPLGIS
jgi:hypothetical protein